MWGVFSSPTRVFFCLFVSIGRKEIRYCGMRAGKGTRNSRAEVGRGFECRGSRSCKRNPSSLALPLKRPPPESPCLPKYAKALQDQYKTSPAVVCQSASLSQHLKCLRALAIFMKGPSPETGASCLRRTDSLHVSFQRTFYPTEFYFVWWSKFPVFSEFPPPPPFPVY